MSRITSSTAGASTCACLVAGGLVLSAGFVPTKPHLTARPSDACSRAWWRRTDAGDKPRPSKER